MDEIYGLPFKPESLERLRSRYQAALVHVFDCRRKVPYPPPSSLRGHVFDFASGVRLIISRERSSDTEQFLHMSASFVPGTEVGIQIMTKKMSIDKFLELAKILFLKLSDDPEPLEFLVFTPGKGIPHWHRREEVS